MINSDDDTATRSVLGSLVACPLTTSEVLQSTGNAVNPSTGQPIMRGTLLVAFGGDFFQKAVAFAERTRAAPVYSVLSLEGNWQYRLAATDQLIAELPANQIGSTHDLLIIELHRDPATGTPMISGYGIDATGTSAAAWYFVTAIAPNPASFTKAWYVFEWTDSGSVGPSDLSEFVEKTLN